ncbi:aldehyde dehydrogenase family protein [Hyphococcus sp.]|uniref:aldehyde dehydrogenase family protein n=1 Tax=Hyphococcus sp. TaxID=2038636 RepID=UPI0035C7012B
MRNYMKFYIGGEWIEPKGAKALDVINPATEKVVGKISLGSAADVDAAVKAARTAFDSWSQTSVDVRIAMTLKIAEIYQKRAGEIGEAISEEMGAPAWLAGGPQAMSAVGHLMTAVEAMKNFKFEEDKGGSHIVKEPIGVCGFITPWNWPMNQLAAKFAPAILTGCTIVHKPSEIAPFSAYLFAEILDEAGLPAGVYNLVNGDGPTVGAAISSHSDIDMVSFTGSTRAGVEVAKAAAPSVKRVHQELGGKSPNIILEDADLGPAVAGSLATLMMNSGQSCLAPTRMIAPNSKMKEILEIAKKAVEDWTPGDPATAKMGPVVSEAQWNKIQGLIEKGVAEGATVVAGGPGKPEGLETGYYVKPTIFADVTNDMTIAREEIFGPVLVIIGYDTEEEAIKIANDTEYGLAGYVQSGDIDHARHVASKIRAGYININNSQMDFSVPFGGYKRSGNGREFGEHAFEEFLELKSVLGYNPAAAA